MIPQQSIPKMGAMLSFMRDCISLIRERERDVCMSVLANDNVMESNVQYIVRILTHDEPDCVFLVA